MCPHASQQPERTTRALWMHMLLQSAHAKPRGNTGTYVAPGSNNVQSLTHSRSKVLHSSLASEQDKHEDG